MSRGQNGMMNGMMNGMNKNLPPAPMGVGFGIRTQDSDVEELKVIPSSYPSSSMF
jgi:hypothetical protein